MGSEFVYGPDILNELEEVVRCFVVLSTQAAVAVALWILHTHAIDAAQITPRLAILSPTRPLPLRGRGEESAKWDG